MDIRAALKNLKIDFKSIEDENLRATIILLFTAVEQFSKEIDVLRKDNQALKDEVNRLKGEQGKPNSRAQTNKNNDHSSESDRKDDDKDGDNNSGKPPKNPKPKKDDIKIDRVERCAVDKSILPDDAVFKGCEPVVVQDIKITTDNIRFDRETYYSPSQNKTFMGALPVGYQGQFGPSIKSLILQLYQDGGMTEPALNRFFETHGIHISAGTISKIITQDIAPFHAEKTDIVYAGLASTDYQHLDDTGSRVNGKNHHTHILCNPFFTAFFTLPKRDRLAAIEVLSNGNLLFCINEDAYQLMTNLGLSDKRLQQLKELNLTSDLMTQAAMDTHIKLLFPNPHKHPASQKIIREAAALIAYQHSTYKTRILLTDGALQFQMITEHQSLCWVHEGRHYKKLNPILWANRELLEKFRTSFWNFYRELLQFKKSPTDKEAMHLSTAFDELFSTKTNYQDLDERIASTLAHKEKLLLVLRFPHIPLHNNPAELGARVQARKRDISLQTKNAAGTKSKDSLMTVTQTAKKLGVNIFKYIYDRVSGKYEMLSLADLIRQKSTQMALVPA